MTHFEDLWEQCEELNKKAVSTTASLIDELLLKTQLLKQMPSKEGKAKILGEILFTITNISLNEDINVYSSLLEALKFHSDR